MTKDVCSLIMGLCALFFVIAPALFGCGWYLYLVYKNEKESKKELYDYRNQVISLLCEIANNSDRLADDFQCYSCKDLNNFVDFKNYLGIDDE